MKPIIYIAMGSAVLAASCAGGSGKIEYPETMRDTTVVDDYFGTRVADPYRWLENDTSAATEAWVEAENAVTDAYLAKIPFRQTLKERMSQLFNYEKMGIPFKRNGKSTLTRPTQSGKPNHQSTLPQQFLLVSTGQHLVEYRINVVHLLSFCLLSI